jgi:hypothetical protein
MSALQRVLASRTVKSGIDLGFTGHFMPLEDFAMELGCSLTETEQMLLSLEKNPKVAVSIVEQTTAHYGLPIKDRLDGLERSPFLGVKRYKVVRFSFLDSKMHNIFP